MQNNISFSYLYRDAGNYKKWGQIVFNNPNNLKIEKIDRRLRNAFDKLYEDVSLFIADQIQIPEVFLYQSTEATEADHCYHEFDKCEVTEDEPNDLLNRSISDFIEEVEQQSRLGWKVFNPTSQILIDSPIKLMEFIIKT